MRQRLLIAWLPAALYVVLIWWLSSQPLVLPQTDWVPMRDRGIHFVEYLGLGVFVAHGVRSTWPGRGMRGTLAAVWVTALAAFGDELHQLYVLGRTADLGDWIADLAGALIGASVYAIVRPSDPAVADESASG